MSTNYLRHLTNMLCGVGGGQLPIEWVILTCCKRQKSVVTLRLHADKHDAVLEDKLYYSKFNFFVEIIPAISHF